MLCGFVKAVVSAVLSVAASEVSSEQILLSDDVKLSFEDEASLAEIDAKTAIPAIIASISASISMYLYFCKNCFIFL